MAISLICGNALLPFAKSPATIAERMKQGRESLVSMTGRDFGYDLQAWHDHLKVSREGGYTYGRNIRLPQIMQVAIDSAEWREAAKQLSAPQTR
jgi:hypothetical protein